MERFPVEHGASLHARAKDSLWGEFGPNGKIGIGIFNDHLIDGYKFML